jgi:hypothetical protein
MLSSVEACGEPLRSPFEGLRVTPLGLCGQLRNDLFRSQFFLLT